MAYVITSQPSKKSKLKRLSFLPRIGVTVDFAGTQYSYFQVPLIENFVNLIGRGFTVNNIIDNAHQQISELELPNETAKKAYTKSSAVPQKRTSKKTTAAKKR